MDRKAKIIATLGPSIFSYQKLKKLIDLGVDSFRINFSHNTKGIDKIVSKIRKFEKVKNKKISLIADLQGIKLRLGNVLKENQKIFYNQKIIFDLNKKPGDSHRINFPYPNILKKIDIKTESLVFMEIYLDNIKEARKKLKDQKTQYQYSDYQKSERDFAFVIDKNFKVQDLVKIISETDTNLIRSVKVFDVYEGENIPENKKSIALNVTIQSSEKTLNDDDLEKINQLIISTVQSKSGAKLRS